MNESGFLTYQEMADRLRVDRTTLRRWVAAGRVPPPVTIGDRSVRFRLADVIAWEQTLSTASEPVASTPALSTR